MARWRHRKLAPPKAARCRKCQGMLDKKGNCAWCLRMSGNPTPPPKKKKGKNQKPLPANVVEEYQGVLERQAKHKLQPLALGSESQTVYGTLTRWRFVLGALRRFERQPNSGEQLERFLVEVRKRHMAPWWMDERNNLEKYFAQLLPPPLPVPTFKAQDAAEEE